MNLIDTDITPNAGEHRLAALTTEAPEPPAATRPGLTGDDQGDPRAQALLRNREVGFAPGPAQSRHSSAADQINESSSQ